MKKSILLSAILSTAIAAGIALAPAAAFADDMKKKDSSMSKMDDKKAMDSKKMDKKKDAMKDGMKK